MRDVLRDVPGTLPPRDEACYHHGLAYGAWAPVADSGGPEDRGKVPEGERASWLAALAARPVSPDYRRAFARWRASFDAPGDRTRELVTRSRLLVGHGLPGATDVGLTLHHTWGVPVIPGSALKGLLAHYVDTAYGPDNPDLPAWDQPADQRDRARYQGVTWNARGRRILRGPGEVYRALFGAPDADEDLAHRGRGLAAGAARGLVVFHDALYAYGPERTERACPFAVDVLTVHQRCYYSSQGDSAPNDYDTPIPISFLSVKPGERMLLALSGPPDWTALAEHLLLDALAAWGVGGKTSTGYGRLGNPPAAGKPTRPEQAHRPGERITVTRIEDRGGKLKFRADDGTPCHFAGEAPPSIEIGASVEVWIGNAAPGNYTLTQRDPGKRAAPGGKPSRSAGPSKGRPR
jgi:CRISPR-associated protein Cmr6